MVTGQEPLTPGPSVHLPDFLSIQNMGRAIGDTGWMGAGLAGAGTKAEKTRQLSCAWRPLALVSLTPAPNFDSDKDRVWQGLWARPQEAWECFALTFSPGLAPNHLPGCFSTSHPSSLWTSAPPLSKDKAPEPPAPLGVPSAISDSREKNHIQS